MKSLHKMILVLAVAALSLSAKQAFSQQEIDPDHFGQPIAAKAVAKAPARKVTVQNHAHGRASAANKHSKHHHSPATA
jgi:hypothetical protein